MLLNVCFPANILPMKTYETQIQQVTISDKIAGTILDIGGGGEGVIGRAYGHNVISIDKRQDELDDAPSKCQKVVMDASDLQFENESFDNTTLFFTMMYIPKDMHVKVINEAYRILKKGGKLYLWDSLIDNNPDNYDVFIIHLNILLQNENIRTGYGVGYKQQDINYYKQLLNDAMFKIELAENHDKTYKIVAVKG